MKQPKRYLCLFLGKLIRAINEGKITEQDLYKSIFYLGVRRSELLNPSKVYSFNESIYDKIKRALLKAEKEGRVAYETPSEDGLNSLLLRNNLNSVKSGLVCYCPAAIKKAVNQDGLVMLRAI